MADIRFNEKSLYIIRSVLTKPDGTERTMYYMTPSMWTANPMSATLFGEYESGIAHLTMYHDRDKAPGGWADGITEVLDVVPLYGALLKESKCQR